MKDSYSLVMDWVCRFYAKEEGRPSRWKDGLTRSFVHSADQHSVRKGRSVWLVATLGPFGPGVMQVSCGAPMNDAEKSRLV